MVVIAKLIDSQFPRHAGDEIDAQYHEEMEELVQLTGTPERAFSMFSEIVKQLFEWDETGRGESGGLCMLRVKRI